MSRSSKPMEAVILLIDVGKAVRKKDNDDQTFLHKSKQCASRIIQRKIFSDSLDQFSLILIGSETTENELDYSNINVKNKWLTSPSWNMLKDIENLSATEVSNVDWLDGLVVAINLLKTEAECKKFTSLKIVMLSNFATPSRNEEQIEDIIHTMRELKISLVVIGPQTEDDGNQEKSAIEEEGERLISRIVEEVDGVICGFAEAKVQLDHYQKSVGKPAPWYCDLQIGNKIFIPITGYKKFQGKGILKWKKKSISDATVTQEYVHFQGDRQVEKEDVINSYLFGDTVVPISDDDKTALSLTNEKCFQLIGFTKKQNVPRHIIIDGSAHYIVPRNGNKGSSLAVAALAKALLDLDMVGVVRKVYCKNAAPRLGSLVPTCEGNSFFFYFVPLPFAEDERNIRLPSLDKVNPTDAQLNAVDNLIQAMDLSQLDEDEDPYSQLVDPSVEHKNNMIVFRAMHPNEELPKEPCDSVKNLLKPPDEILFNASGALNTIKELFPLEEVEQKTYRRGAADVFDRTSTTDTVNGVEIKQENLADSLASFVQSTVSEVGTIDPEGNFNNLLEKGEPFSKVCEQMQSAIRKLVFTSRDAGGTVKPLSALSTLRRHCIIKDPARYNRFVASLKDDLLQRDHNQFWDLIVQDRLGLVTSDESDQSVVSGDEAEVFYEIKTCESQNEENYEMEAEDMLDML